MLRLGKSSRTAPGLNSWPVLACFTLGLLLPSAALLWFMGKAIQNERIAVSQRLLESYRSQMPFLQQELAHFWLNLSNRALALQTTHTNSPGALFHSVLGAGLAHGALVLSNQTHLLYPNSPAPVSLPITTSPEWLAAARLEEAGSLVPAAEAYATLARRRPNPLERAPALLAQARCLQRANQPDHAVGLLQQLAAPLYQDCVDSSGRLISPNADLALLELLQPSGHAFSETATRLAARLNSYAPPELSSSQRRFLMIELQRLNPSVQLPTLPAEQLSANYLVTSPAAPFQSTSEVFVFPAADLLLLFRPPALQAQITSELQARLPPGVQISLIPPGDDPAPNAIATARAASEMPGWKLALHLTDSSALQSLANDQINGYLWTGILVLITMGFVTVISARLLTRRMRVARLKSDLVANVTHELKTPLASIRLLVDTLLDKAHPDPKTTREYLELISRENSRLTRLVENFLAFSRMERNKHSFDFQELDPAALAQSAAHALHEKFAAASCQFQLDLAPDLPRIRGDADSLVTALINLLDNAFKYTGDEKQITLRAAAANSTVLFEITDNGMGIPAAALPKIFRRFYQVDPSLSRRGSGCGLGLSIVDFIIRSHGGTIEVQSEPGRGSTFRVLLPALAPTLPKSAPKEPACN